MSWKDYEGEKALEVMADLLEPAQEIFTDPEVVSVIRATDEKLKWVATILKKQPKAVIRMMAILDGENPEEYKVNVLTLPIKILSLFNDPEITSLFQSQGQTKENASSGSAAENTEA